MEKRKRGKLHTLILVVSAVVAVTAAFLLFLLYTRPGRRLTSKVAAGYIHGAVNYVSGEENKFENSKYATSVSSKPEQEGDTTGTEVGTNADVKEEEEAEKQEREYYHILLLGEEALKTSAGNGRTDTIILLTVMVKQKKFMLSSVLRDVYVEPDDLYPCKINGVYKHKGVKGLYEILYEKLGIWPDGYVKVGFDSFEKIINLVGGAKVTLTKQEADYLNTHNYISNPEYRNVVEGTQILNGNQTLGYCRVRHVANCNGTKYDYGRTERQRMVIKSLFEQYKDAGITKWLKILKEALSYIETDIDEKLMEELIFVVYDNQIKEIQQQQIPAKGTFVSEDKIGNVTSTLVVDWEKNKELLWSILE